MTSPLSKLSLSGSAQLLRAVVDLGQTIFHWRNSDCVSGLSPALKKQQESTKEYTLSGQTSGCIKVSLFSSILNIYNKSKMTRPSGNIESLEAKCSYLLCCNSRSGMVRERKDLPTSHSKHVNITGSRIPLILQRLRRTPTKGKERHLKPQKDAQDIEGYQATGMTADSAV